MGTVAGILFETKKAGKKEEETCMATTFFISTFISR